MKWIPVSKQPPFGVKLFWQYTADGQPNHCCGYLKSMTKYDTYNEIVVTRDGDSLELVGDFTHYAIPTPPKK